MTGRYQTYPEYKESGSKWLDEVPSGWKVTALKHVLVTPITDGPHSTPTFLDEGIPFVSAEAVSGGYINFNKIRGYISEEDDVFFSQKYRPQRNDVYMIKSGATTGITAIVETDKRFNIWSPLAVMRCKDRYNSYFLLNYLRSDTFQNSVQLSWTFGTQQNIGMNILENLTVCYPPFEEQQKIANFLDHETAKIDTLIAKQEKLIELLKEKRQAVISHAVTRGLNPDAPMKDSGIEWLDEVPEHWEVKRLKYLCNIQTGSRNTENAIDNGKYPFFVRSQKVERINSKTFNCEAVLTAGDGVGVGKVYHYIDGEFDFHQRVYMLNKFKLTSGMFIFNYLEQNFYKVAMAGQAKSTVDSLRLPLFLNFEITVPPKSEQDEIIKYIDNIKETFDLLTSNTNKAIKLMKERKKALISAAVTGKIDVRNWQES